MCRRNLSPRRTDPSGRTGSRRCGIPAPSRGWNRSYTAGPWAARWQIRCRSRCRWKSCRPRSGGKSSRAQCRSAGSHCDTCGYTPHPSPHRCPPRAGLRSFPCTPGCAPRRGWGRWNSCLRAHCSWWGHSPSCTAAAAALPRPRCQNQKWASAAHTSHPDAGGSSGRWGGCRPRAGWCPAG